MNSLLAVTAGSPGPDWASQLTGIGTIALAVLALLALIGTVYQLWRNRVGERETRAHQYLARYNEADQIPLIVKMRRFIQLRGTAESERLKEWEDMDSADKLRTVHILNFWEELGGMYNRKQVDQAIVRDYFGAAAMGVWEDGMWFAAYLRGRNPRAMEQLERMCADIRRREAKEAAKKK